MVFKASDIPNLTGKVAIVTGANTGIGKACATELARHGAHVIMACRNPEKASAAVEDVKKASGSDLVEFMELDLSSLRSVEAFATAFINRKLPLHLLLNNAGVMAAPYSLTKDGIENQFGTNHIGHFYLTLLLFDLLEQNQPSRIVNVSSGAHLWAPTGGISFDSINNEAGYKEFTAYGQSKLANILFTKELARRTQGKKIYVNTLHPGWVATDLQRYVKQWSRAVVFFFSAAQRVFAMPPEKGALTQLYLSTSPDVEEKDIRGEYYVPTAKKSKASDLGCNEELAKKLWEFSIKLVEEKVGSIHVPESLRE